MDILISEALENPNPIPIKSHKLKLVNRDGFQLVKINEVIYCQGEGNYTRFILKNGVTSMTSKTLKIYEALLQDHGFFRAHKSYLINMDHITKYLSKGKSGELIMSNGQTIELSKNMRPLFFDCLERYHL